MKSWKKASLGTGKSWCEVSEVGMGLTRCIDRNMVPVLKRRTGVGWG